MLKIRFAEKKDVHQIFKFIQALAEFEKLSHEVVATESLLEQSLFGGRPAAEVLVAELDKVPVGFALFFQNFSTFLARPGIYLEDLFVLPEYRGQGVGKALLKKLAEITVSRDFGRLEWAVLDWNKSALDFYESLGAHPKKDWIVHRLTGEALHKLSHSATEATVSTTGAPK